MAKTDEAKALTVHYCRDCANGGEVENLKVMCKIRGYWQHSPLDCRTFKNK